MFFDVEFPTDSAALYKNLYRDGILPEINKQGLALFNPYDVAGYDAYYQSPNYNRNWITPLYLAHRYQFMGFLLTGKKADETNLGIQIDILSWVDNTEHISNPSDAEALVSRLVELLFPFPVSTERLDYFIDGILMDGMVNYRGNWTTEWNSYKNGSSSAEENVTIALTRLFKGLMQSPEYQLY